MPHYRFQNNFYGSDGKLYKKGGTYPLDDDFAVPKSAKVVEAPASTDPFTAAEEPQSLSEMSKAKSPNSKRSGGG